MDFNEKKLEYYALKPPVYVPQTNTMSSYYVYLFDDNEKRLIRDAILPEGMDKKEIARKRHILLLELQKLAATPEEQQWVGSMIVNETCGFVKRMVAKYCFKAEQHYCDMMNLCFETVLREYPGYENKTEYTLTTYLTLPLIHTLKQYVNSERYKSSDHRSSNASKVQYALDFYRMNGNPNPTIMDIAAVTKMTEKAISDTLATIQANNAMNLDDKEVLGMASNGISPEEYALTEEKKNVVASLLSQFSDFERQCIELKFDISNTHGEKRSVAKVAGILGTTSNEVNKAINKVFRTLKRSKMLRSLIYGEERIVQKEKIPDQKKINAYFEDVLQDMDEEEGTQKPVPKEQTDKEQNMKLPW